MNSEKAHDVRDAINGLPCVAHDPKVYSNYPSDGHTTTNFGGVERTHTGECVMNPSNDYAFIPARVNESGQIAFGDDAPKRPCYEVVLEPLTFPKRPLPTISIPPAVVHEVAKYDCRLRVTSGLRGEWTPGTIHIRDDLAHSQDPDRDGDRCPDCRGTRFKLKGGVPECERCGTRLEEEGTDYTPTLEEYA